jgi:hypothetical protein
MKRIEWFVAFWAFLMLAVAGCDEGLKPVPSVPTGGLSGLVSYHHWPPRDSLYDLRLVAFRTFPPRDIVGEVLQGNAFVYPGLGDSALVPFFVDSLRYSITLPAGEYAYLVIAQQYGPNLNKDWRPVGQYDLDTNRAAPSPVTVVPDSTITNINIDVDFENPPPPPF